MTDRYVVVMAGGSGTRFWPASREKHPKQFLSIGGDRSLLRQTVDRIREMVDWKNLIVVTARVHADHARLELPELPEENLLVEPVGRNTAPCIGWAAKVIAKRSPEAIVAVLPADHFIGDAASFRAHLDAAMNAAGSGIALLGLVPTRPETGYGYIKQGSLREDAGGLPVHEVEAFVEKPDAETAAKYLGEGGYLWNSGMFVFTASAMLGAIERHLPELAMGLAALEAEPKKMDTYYPKLPNISIDYGVMEKEVPGNVRVVPSTFPWSDVGSWDAAFELYPPDAEGNVVLGDAIVLSSAGCLVDARGGRVVAVVGSRDLVVVDTTDALLVVARGNTQAVKRVVEILAAKGRTELL